MPILYRFIFLQTIDIRAEIDMAVPIPGSSHLCGSVENTDEEEPAEDTNISNTIQVQILPGSGGASCRKSSGFVNVHIAMIFISALFKTITSVSIY